MDSILSVQKIENPAKFEIGFSKISLTPTSPVPLAGFGARKPKTYESILDSVSLRTLVIRNGKKKIAIVSAELLLIHPSIVKSLKQKLKQTNWSFENIFLTATHTHSSIGQWAPGVVGEIISGTYDEKVVEIISNKIMKGLKIASQNLLEAKISSSKIGADELVKNRVVGEKGEEDKHIRTIYFQTELGKIVFATFSAHATCFGIGNRKLTGDFPSYFYYSMDKDKNVLFSVYSAGAVGSMGNDLPEEFKKTPWEQFIGTQISKKLKKTISQNIIQPDSLLSVQATKIPLFLPKPQFKISRDFVLRPYVFQYLFKEEKAVISILKMNKNLMIGLPCDFSGELAVPLYEYAQQKGLNLIITSFNGGYIGYITKDEWYDLPHYETRSMNWYGVGTGAYFSEIIKKIINNYAKE